MKPCPNSYCENGRTSWFRDDIICGDSICPTCLGKGQVPESLEDTTLSQLLKEFKDKFIEKANAMDNFGESQKPFRRDDDLPLREYRTSPVAQDLKKGGDDKMTTKKEWPKPCSTSGASSTLAPLLTGHFSQMGDTDIQSKQAEFLTQPDMGAVSLAPSPSVEKSLEEQAQLCISIGAGVSKGHFTQASGLYQIENILQAGADHAAKGPSKYEDCYFDALGQLRSTQEQLSLATARAERAEKLLANVKHLFSENQDLVDYIDVSIEVGHPKL